MKKFFLAFVILASLFIITTPTKAAEGQFIIINKATNKLAFYNDGKLVKTFSVATGRETTYTPEGKFLIVNKIKNRPYYKEGIPGGDPRNPLGDRWLGLHARGTYGTTYGIHGNNNESSIGKYVSSGCVRMHNSEIRWLFDQVNVYTPVVIINSSKSFEEIAKDNGYNPKQAISISISSVQTDKNSPQTYDNKIKITTNAKVTGSNNVLYKYLISDGNGWSTLSDYSNSNIVTWTASKDGTYTIRAIVKAKESSKEVSKDITFTMIEPIGAIEKFSTFAKGTAELKSEPTLNATTLTTIPHGEGITLTGEPVEAESLLWYASSAGTNVGFINQNQLKFINRLSGKDRFEVAKNISNTGWSQANTVILANHQAFADALSASSLAFKENAPILLSRSDALSIDTINEIKRLKPSKVIIAGGPGSIGENIVHQLKNELGVASVERLGGKDRYEVAYNISKRLGPTTTAVIADGMNFPDALSIAPYAAKNGMPILLANKDVLPPVIKQSLVEQNIQQTIVVGGQASVGNSVFDQLPNPIRIDGKDRYEVATNIIKQLSLEPKKSFIATGLTFADALTGSVLAAKEDAVMLLTRKPALPPETKSVILEKGISRFTILGGTGSVSSSGVFSELVKQ